MNVTKEKTIAKLSEPFALSDQTAWMSRDGHPTDMLSAASLPSPPRIGVSVMARGKSPLTHSAQFAGKTGQISSTQFNREAVSFSLASIWLAATG